MRLDPTILYKDSTTPRGVYGAFPYLWKKKDPRGRGKGGKLAAGRRQLAEDREDLNRGMTGEAAEAREEKSSRQLAAGRGQRAERKG